MKTYCNGWIWGRPKKTKAPAFYRERNLADIFYSNAKTDYKKTNDLLNPPSQNKTGAHYLVLLDADKKKQSSGLLWKLNERIHVSAQIEAKITQELNPHLILLYFKFGAGNGFSGKKQRKIERRLTKKGVVKHDSR